MKDKTPEEWIHAESCDAETEILTEADKLEASINKEHDQPDSAVISAMISRGGSFVQALGEAALRADPQNLRLIKNTWAYEWLEYSKMAEHIEKERRKNE